jgi:hypothetical protein
MENTAAAVAEFREDIIKVFEKHGRYGPSRISRSSSDSKSGSSAVTASQGYEGDVESSNPSLPRDSMLPDHDTSMTSDIQVIGFSG